MYADAIYSATLIIALIAGAAAIAGAAIGAAMRQREARWARFARPAAVISWIFLALSIGVHVSSGHAPGSAQALSPFAFLREHLAFVVAAALPCVALAIRAGSGGNRAA